MAVTLTLEQENAIRSRNGLPLLEVPAELSDDEKAQIEENEKKQKEENEKAEKEKLALQNQPPAEIDEALLLKELQKRNPAIKSIADITPQPTEEELARQKQERESSKISWALSTGKIKKEEYEDYVVTSKDPKALILANYIAEVKEANPEMGDDEVKSIVDEKFGLNQDPEHWKYKQGQRELKLMADQLMKDRFGKVLSIDNEYSAYESAETEKNSRQAKVIANAPAFKADVDEVFLGFKTIPQTIAGQTFEVELPQAFLDRAKNSFLSEDYVVKSTLNGWDKKEIQDIVYNMAIIENHSYLTQKAAEKFMEINQKGSRGIIPPKGFKSGPPPITMDEKQEKAAERHGAKVPEKPTETAK